MSAYANWFPKRHRRSNHLFQSRFRGELIEDESYFRTVSRYLQLNPTRGKHPFERKIHFRIDSQDHRRAPPFVVATYFQFPIVVNHPRGFNAAPLLGLRRFFLCFAVIQAGLSGILALVDNGVCCQQAPQLIAG